jgi:YYY domain-containing protein
MLMSDFIAVVSWWLIIQILGLIVWPLAFRWLRWLPDRGYMLSKPLGLLMVSYGVWLLASFGIVQNTAGGIIAVLIGVALIGIIVYRRNSNPISNVQPPTSITQFLKDHRTLIVAYEVLFLLALIGWSIFRAHNPDLSTTEKPMEFAFFNAIGRSATFPPHDPWLAGYSIAYYYFGYVMMSIMHQLSGVTTGVAFSLSNSFWFALSAATAFGVVANLVLISNRSAKWAAITFGSLGAIMLVLMGSFEGSLELAHANNIGSTEMWQWLDVQELNMPPVQNSPNRPLEQPRDGWWWWRASRVIHDYPPNAISPQLAGVINTPPAANNTYQELIDEFPQFSFILGDMHPHVLSLPFALLIIGLALNLFVGSASGEIKTLVAVPGWPLYAIVIGGMSFVNTWDFPVYAFLAVAALALGRWRADRFDLIDTLADLAVIAFTGVLLYLPFYRGLTSQAKGVLPNLVNGTRPAQFFIMFGPFIVIGLLLGLAMVIDLVRSKRVRLVPFAIRSILGAIGLIVVTAIGVALVSGGELLVSQQARDASQGLINTLAQIGVTPTDHLLARLISPWVPLGLAVSLVAVILIWRAPRSGQPPAGLLDDVQSARNLREVSGVDFVLLLYALGLLLTFVVEFAYIGDNFGTRMNTVFKLYYQTWAMWSVASAFGVYYLLHEATRKPIWRALTIGLSVIAIGLGLVYPLLAIPAKAGSINPTLDAMQGAATADESAAIDWLNRYAPDNAIVLEAPGDEYNAGTSRVSTWTGLSTVVGWARHEDQWRGDCDIQCPRVQDVNDIYSSGDVAKVTDLLNKYQVTYVYVGPNERRLYLPAALNKFDQLLPAVFRQGIVVIYQVGKK